VSGATSLSNTPHTTPSAGGTNNGGNGNNGGTNGNTGGTNGNNGDTNGNSGIIINNGKNGSVRLDISIVIVLLLSIAGFILSM
jgi:hypothetical protein